MKPNLQTLAKLLSKATGLTVKEIKNNVQLNKLFKNGTVETDLIISKYSSVIQVIQSMKTSPLGYEGVERVLFHKLIDYDVVSVDNALCITSITLKDPLVNLINLSAIYESVDDNIKALVTLVKDMEVKIINDIVDELGGIMMDIINEICPYPFEKTKWYSNIMTLVLSSSAGTEMSRPLIKMQPITLGYISVDQLKEIVLACNNMLQSRGVLNDNYKYLTVNCSYDFDEEIHLVCTNSNFLNNAFVNARQNMESYENGKNIMRYIDSAKKSKNEEDSITRFFE